MTKAKMVKKNWWYEKVVVKHITAIVFLYNELHKYPLTTFLILHSP